MNQEREFLTPKQAAELMGVSPQTLANWRCAGRPPVYKKLGGRIVRYHINDLRAWMDSFTVLPRDEGGHED